MIALLVLACHGVDPDLAATRQALDAWTEGNAKLASGDSAGAALAFERARAARNGDMLLVAWDAKALADQGRLDEAIQLLDGILALQPDFGEARYNRAAWLARSGKPERAAADLRQALDEDVRRPREVLSDPDFRKYLDDPAFAFLPRAALSVEVDAPKGPVFWGSETRLRLRITGAGDGPIRVSGTASGPIEVGTVLEDVRWSTDGPVHDLSWQLRVVGPGTATLGPITASGDLGSSELDPIAFACAAPPGKQAPPEAPAQLVAPSGLAGAWATPSAHRAAGEIWVRVAPGDRVETDPPLGTPGSHLELRDGGETKFAVEGWADPGSPVKVRVLRAGALVWEGAAE